MFRKWQTLRKRSKGFTLIELMIVVAIIAILAAIAIPQYKKFQLKAKTAEAKANIGAIYHCEVSYAAETGKLLTEAYYPGGAGKNKQTWNEANSGNFSSLGFTSAGPVYYDYGITSGDHTSDPSSANPASGNVTDGDGPNITILARGDLDGDGQYSYYCTCEETRSIIGPKGDRF